MLEANINCTDLFPDISLEGLFNGTPILVMFNELHGEEVRIEIWWKTLYEFFINFIVDRFHLIAYVSTRWFYMLRSRRGAI